MIMLKIVILVFSSFAIQQCSSKLAEPTSSPILPSLSEEISDYYWREYTGIIPSDAIPGGTDKTGKPTYIGQMYRSSFGLLPATIYPGSKSARASGGGNSFSADTFVKILCSRNHDRYNWIPTKNEETHLLTNCHLVIGGTEAGFVLNIGRANHEMETTIGKVFAHHTPYRGLSIPDKAKEVTFQTYEILTYNCPMNQFLPNNTYVSVC